ncbi:TrkA C-terminal domain-containing protein [Natrinema versiforme]|uniref:Potassium transporter TrkA n=1 Tax=Natrinema versiforme TaxID=88724 RepID=A0A4P8WMA6_9EURY|nr:TrkA C-terminal domain-containing protein [Natrinema versiforme]QCS44630.1 potassium transporter TrkA [Natrinema versiforme]
MVLESASELLLGVYLGLLAAIFPAFIAFSIGFIFKYFTTVTIPGLGVVALGGTLAGVSGGLMGLIDPTLAGSWTGITAVLVILMASLWAHSQGDKLATATPRKLTLKALRETTLSADLAERIDSYGQVHIRPIGGISDIEGYPPLPDNLRHQVGTSSWRFPATLSLSELETKLEERLLTDYELAEASATIDKQGRAQIAAAPTAAGLSRRVPSGRRAVSIQTVLPTGVGRGDRVTVKLPDGDVTGPVVSARTTGAEVPTEPTEAEAKQTDGGDEPVTQLTPKMTTTGGEGEVTIAVPYEDGRRVIRSEFAPMTIHSRGKQREYEMIGILKRGGNRFRTVMVADGSPLAGMTVGDQQVRSNYGVTILAIRRPEGSIIAPTGSTELHAGDSLILAGKPEKLREFEEVMA